MISRYEDEIKSLKEYIQELHTERAEIINISSSSGENSFSDKQNDKEEIDELKLKNKKLTELLEEQEKIIADAKEMYYALEQDYKNVQQENKELATEYFNLQRCYDGTCSPVNVM